MTKAAVTARAAAGSGATGTVTLSAVAYGYVAVGTDDAGGHEAWRRRMRAFARASGMGLRETHMGHGVRPGALCRPALDEPPEDPDGAGAFVLVPSMGRLSPRRAVRAAVCDVLSARGRLVVTLPEEGGRPSHAG